METETLLGLYVPSFMFNKHFAHKPLLWQHRASFTKPQEETLANLEVARSMSKALQSLWDQTGGSTAVLPIHLSDPRETGALEQTTSRPQEIPGNTPHGLVSRGQVSRVREVIMPQIR